MRPSRAKLVATASSTKMKSVACLFGMAAAAPSWPLAPIMVDSVSVPHYNFNYGVSDPHTGDYKTQHESRAGGVVKGSYSVAEPDGTLRVVDYSADPHSGFNAHVKKIGAAVHPPQIIATPIWSKEIIAPIHAPIITQSPWLGPIGYPSLAYGGYKLSPGLGYPYGLYGH